MFDLRLAMAGFAPMPNLEAIIHLGPPSQPRVRTRFCPTLREAAFGTG
jgi:hypothetical protein